MTYESMMASKRIELESPHPVNLAFVRAQGDHVNVIFLKVIDDGQSIEEELEKIAAEYKAEEILNVTHQKISESESSQVHRFDVELATEKVIDYRILKDNFSILLTVILDFSEIDMTEIIQSIKLSS